MFEDLTTFDLSAEEQRLRDEARRFVREVVDPLDLGEYEWRDDPKDRIPWEAIEAAHDRGLHDLAVPEEFGGHDASPLALAAAAEELSVGDMAIAINIDQMWKVCRLIDGLASDALRERFFTEFVDDPRHLLALGLTEPAHGSNYVIDHEEMQFGTTAERDGDEWVINGRKRFISCLPEAKSMVLYAQTDPDVSAQEGTTAFLVPTDADGFEISNVWDRIVVRLHNQATIDFDDVRVPAENALGEVNAAKRSTAEVLKESSIEAGAIALGTARRAFDDALEYAYIRVQGGTEIIDHQAVSTDFARMATEIETARSMLWTAARAVEAMGADYDPVLGQMAKVNASTTAVDVCQAALEKFGGLGVMLENTWPAERYLRNSLTYLHADGTVNAHHVVIANALEERFADARGGD